jgi:hypothetical protein
MKKVLFFLLMSTMVFSQQVTSYRNGFANDAKYQLPITFHNYLDVQENVQKFLRNELFMTEDEEKSGYDVVGKDTIWIFHYTENGFNKNHFESLKVKYNIIKAAESSVFTNTEITGDTDVVVKFWAYFWTTSPKFSYNNKVGLLAENSFMCDKIQLHRISNGAKITITNTCYNKDSFLKKLPEWQKIDKENVIQQKLSEEKREEEYQKQVEQEKIKKTPTIYPKQGFEYKEVHFTKSNKGFVFSQTIYKELEDQIKQDFKTDKNGIYTAFYDVSLLDNKVSKIKLKGRLNR